MRQRSWQPSALHFWVPIVSCLFCFICIFALFQPLPFTTAKAQAACAGSAISGTAFRDYNANGVHDALEPGLAGITITAYDASGGSVVCTSTTNGSYGLDPAGAYPVRLEYTLPADGSMSFLQPGAAGPDSHTTVTFVSGPGQGVNVGFSNPRDYCQSNPQLAVSCSVFGEQKDNPDGVNKDLAVLYGFPYTAGSTDIANSVEVRKPSPTSLAAAKSLGTTWGLTWSPLTKRLYSAAFLKRHAGYGPNGPGAIYQIDTSGAVTLFYDLGAVVGADPHAQAGQTCLSPGHNPNNNNFNCWLNDSNSFDLIGKMGLGDLDISEDYQTLYTINLQNRTLVALPVNNPAGNTATAIPIPANCPATDFRPFGLGIQDGSVYVGAVCSAESTSVRSNLRAYVFRFTQNAFVATPVFEFALDYNRGGNLNWQPWLNRTTFNPGVPQQLEGKWGQPWLTDIAFDKGAMVLGLRDRNGDLFGVVAGGPDPADPRNYTGISRGDILRACPDGSGGWTMENNGQCGGVTTAGAGAGQGPGGGEYYYQDAHPRHNETSTGAQVQIPGQPDIASMSFNPINQDLEVSDSGVKWYNNLTGATTRSYLIIDGSGEVARFDKANALGDIEALCNAAPLEIGNRVWNDTNGNGVQDPSEAGINGVVVELYQEGVLVASTTTAGDGNYLFNNSNVTLNGAQGIQPGTCGANGLSAYEIRIPNSSGVNQQAALAGLVLTQANNGGASNGVLRDSNGVAVGNNAVYAIPCAELAAAGYNNHTFDFGFSQLILGALGDRVWLDANGDGVQDAGETGLVGVQMILTNSAGVTQTTTTGADGIYHFTNLPADTYKVTVNLTTLPPGLGQTYDLDGLATPHTATATLAAGQNRTDVDFGYQPSALGCIGDTVWLDTNGNGVQDNSEQGIGNVQMILSNSQGVTQTLTTDNVGHYLFCQLPADTYTVRVNPNTLPPNVTQTYDLDGLTTPHVATAPLAASQTRLDVDFGYQPPALGCIGDTVWLDANGDGLLNTGEQGISSVQLILSNSLGVTQTVSTDADGHYLVCQLPADTYTVRVNPSTLPPNVTQTYDLDGLTTPHVATAPLTAGQTRLDVDFGYQPPVLGCIGDTVWLDVNGDGSQSSAEQGIAGVQLILTNSQGVTQTLTTDSTGHYLFCQLPADTYTVRVNPNTLPLNVTQTYDLDGLATPHTATATLATGQTRLDVDFGYQPPATVLACIGDFVWLDVNADGIQDTDETGVAGQNVTLYDGAGNVVLTTTTDASGHYSFCNLLPGNYAVGFTPPSDDFVISPPNRGGDAAKDSDANETTGRTVVTTLSPGEQDMTWDLGMYAPPELFIQKSANLTLVQPGNTILYTLAYSNTGKGVATGVTITETVPAHTSFASAASTPNWVCAGNQVKAGTQCTFNVGTLAAGASGKITFATVVDAILQEDVTVIDNTVVAIDDKKHGSKPGGQSSSQVKTPIFRPTGLETAPEPHAPAAGHSIFLPQVKR